MEGVYKYLAGAVSGLLGFFAPVAALVCCAVVFVGIDFVTGVAASWKRARRTGTQWGFESEKAWNTVTKLAFIMAGIVLAWVIDTYILDFLNMRMANLFTGFVCGVEFWSYLENAAEISRHPVFLRLRKIMKSKLDEQFPSDEEG